MFFVGLSCSILPYIFAILFAWIFVGNTSAKNVNFDDTVVETKVIKYQSGESKAAKCYKYHKYFDNTLISASLPQYFIKLNCWRELYVDIPLSDILLINPIKRGPPQVL